MREKYRLKKGMTKLLTILIVTILFPSLVIAEKYESENSHRVLFLGSYSLSWATVPYQLSGLRSSLDPLGYTIEYEFMDSKNIKYGEDYKEFYDLLNYKIKSLPAFDGVIVADDAALRFVQIYQEELFQDIPVVFQGIDDIENAILASQDPLVTGVVEKANYRKNLELAQALQPHAEDLIILYDGTESGIGILEQVKKEKDLFSDYQVHYVNSSDYNIKELCDYFDNFPNQYIIFLAIMGEEKGGKIIPDSEAYHIINHHIQQPVYRFTHAGLGKGILGGYIVNHEQCGWMAGQMMHTILAEDTVPDVVMETPHSYILDYNIIKKYGISQYRLPEDATIINRPEGFFDKYNKSIINTLVFGMGILAIGLYMNSLSRRRLLATNLELQKTQKYLTHQNYHDDLTDLPNRKNILEELEALIERNIPHAAIIIDIDDFKEINMAFGDDCGDKVLNAVSERLEGLAKKEKLKISRFSGDEFLVLALEDNERIIEALAAKIRTELLRMIEIEDVAIFLQISMGIAIYMQDLDKGLAIISNASLALAEAKKQGKNTNIYYDDKMRHHFVVRKKVEDTLKNACEEDGFKILYQPQVDMKSNIVGYEALLRLKDNIYYPEDFIPVAEGTDLILKIGRIVTQKVVQQLAAWRDDGMELKPVSINFSNRQIRDKGYVEFLAATLDEYDIDPSLIEIEITENILINNDKEAEELCYDFLNLGISLALDDFGTGYSSIRYLTYLPVNKIKIDRSLVQMFIHRNEGEFMGNIIRLAHSLGLEITIEGVETLEEYEIVKKLGGDFVQGYYFSKPIEAQEVRNLDSPIR